MDEYGEPAEEEVEPKLADMTGCCLSAAAYMDCCGAELPQNHRAQGNRSCRSTRGAER